jgi:hypothetical protein
MDVLTWVRTQWDRVGAWVAILAGAVAIILGWLGVSGTGFTSEQIPYIVSGGLGGLFLLGLGATIWISADLRDEWRKLDAIERHLSGTGAEFELAPTVTGNGSLKEGDSASSHRQPAHQARKTAATPRTKTGYRS